MSVASLRPQTQKSVGNRFYPLNSAQPTLSKNRPSRWLVLKWPALAGFEVATDNAGILFEHGQELVNLFFMLGTPESQPGEYLVVLRALCKICKAPADRAALLAAPTPATFIAAVAATETRLGL
jgi:hypothetical protein